MAFIRADFLVEQTESGSAIPRPLKHWHEDSLNDARVVS